MTIYNVPTDDFITTSLNDDVAAAAASIVLAADLDGKIPATNGIMQIDYDSTAAVGAANGPETISYATYTSGTKTLGGCVRGLAGTTDVAHDSGRSIHCAPSSFYYNNAISAAGANFIGAKAYLAATLGTTVSEAATKVALDTEAYDIGANFASNKFVAPVTGYYLIQGRITFTSTDAKNFAGWIYKNNAAITETYTQGAATASYVSVCFSEVVALTAADYIELFYYHDAATTTDLLGGAGNTFMSVTLLK